jgi:hypothetical protein
MAEDLDHGGEQARAAQRVARSGFRGAPNAGYSGLRPALGEAEE